MNKVLIGVGIGCGLLVLVVIGVLAAGGMWVKGKAEEAGLTVEGMEAAGEKMEAHEAKAKALNEKYTFKAPPKGQPLRVEEDRLQDYLAVRASMKPVIDKLEAQGKKLDHLKDDKQQAGFGDMMAAGGMMMELMSGVQEAWLEGLEEQEMSPTEFHTITAALITSEMGKGMGQALQNQRPALEKLKASLEQQANNPNMPQEVRDGAREQIPEIEKQIQRLPAPGSAPPEADAIHAANAELYQKHKDAFEKSGGLGMDVFLYGYAEQGSLGEAMQNAMQPYGMNPDDAEAQ